MIINTLDAAEFAAAFGINMAVIIALEAQGTPPLSAAWGRVAPGVISEPHRHDETEAFVIIRGEGDVIVDGKRHRVGPGTVVVFEPFEGHVIENAGPGELVFVDLYWRDPKRAQVSADSASARFDGRPVFVFSTPPTPNGDLHLGHLSGPYLGADVFVRFQRMNGVEAWHLTGSDDFQSYVVDCARREQRTPAEVATFYSAAMKATLDLMDIPLDQYTVTSTDPRYQNGVQTFFSRIVASGVIAQQEREALVDGQTGQYLYEVDVRGTCPTCAASTGGNICEECGEPNGCVELVQPRSKVSDVAPVRKLVTRFILPLRDFRDVVVKHHKNGRISPRLRDLSERVLGRERLDIPVTHPADWGVRPREEGSEDQVIWVWPEMAFGFLHGIGELARRLGRNWSADTPQQDWKIVHFFGYDNAFYHTILYPVLYKLAYPSWNPDIDYHYNEFYLLDGAKFSTSRRHAIWGKEIIEPKTVDAVRWYLSLTRPESERTNFELAKCQAMVKDRLIDGWQAWLNDLGARIEVHFAGSAPDAGVWTLEHKAFLAALGTRLAGIRVHLDADGFSLSRAVRELNALVDDTIEFKRVNERLGTIESLKDEYRTAVALELASARLLSLCAAPVMPRFAATLARALGDTEQPKWPDKVILIRPGTAIVLAGTNFFPVANARLFAPIDADK